MSTFNTCCKLCCFELWCVTANSFLELSTHFYRAMAQHPYVIFLLVSEDGAQNIMRNIPRHTDPPQIQPMTTPKKADLSWSWQKYFPEGYFTSYIIYLYLALWVSIVEEKNDHIEMYCMGSKKRSLSNGNSLVPLLPGNGRKKREIDLLENAIFFRQRFIQLLGPHFLWNNSTF